MSSARALRSNKHRALAKRAFLGPIDENTALSSSIVSTDNNNNKQQEDGLEGFDGANEAHVLSYILDVEKELSKRKLSMDVEAENLCLQLETVKQSSFVKLNKAVRKMTVKHFLEHYGGDLDAACQAVLQSNIPTTNSNSSNTSNGKVDDYGRPLRTPARVGAPSTSLVGRTPATVRAAKRGEILFSENGSPIEIDQRNTSNSNDNIILSVKKKKSQSGDAATASSVISINVGRHDISIDLSNPDDFANLDADQRACALLQLKSFQDQVGDLMGRFAKNL